MSSTNQSNAAEYLCVSHLKVSDVLMAPVYPFVHPSRQEDKSLIFVCGNKIIYNKRMTKWSGGVGA